jgi:site-specific DNA recombinase
MPLRIARWAAVSTDSQAAPDKVSITIQLEKAANVAASRGWVETAGPYIVTGESRTRFVSLRDAEQHIPQLKQLLDAASRHEFDCLITYDLNRFRSLSRQVFDVLTDYNVQLYILNNPREPLPPEQYDDDAKSAVGMLVDMGGIISQSEITSLRRHYREKMPARVTTHGLHAGTGLPPYGYTKAPADTYNRRAILVPDPVTSLVVIEIKDLYLKGLSITRIANTLNKNGIPSPRGKKWVHAAIAYILRNPFYAGITSWGKIKVQRDRRTGGRTYLPNNPSTTVGKHQPLYDLATYQKIQSTLKRRGKPHPGERTMQLSRLLYCPCGRLMWARRPNSYKAHDDFIWYCSTESKGHARISDAQIYPRIIALIVKTIKNKKGIKLPKPPKVLPALTKKMQELERRKKRWMDAFELGTIDARDYTERTASLTAQMDTVQKEMNDLQDSALKIETRRAELTQLAKAVDSLEYYFLNAPPQEVNADLRSLMDRIEITPNHTPRIIWDNSSR